MSDKKIDKAIETKIVFLQTNIRKNLIAKREQLQIVALKTFETIIVELFFVLTRNVNASLIVNFTKTQLINNNIDKLSTNNNQNNKKIKIEIVSLKTKKLKFDKMRFVKILTQIRIEFKHCINVVFLLTRM